MNTKEVNKALKEHDKLLDKERERKKKEEAKQLGRDNTSTPSILKEPDSRIAGNFVQKKPPSPHEFDKMPDRQDIREEKKKSLAESRAIAKKANERLRASRQRKTNDRIKQIKKKRQDRNMDKDKER